MIKKSELLKEIKDIFSKLPECTDDYLKALDYAAFLAEQDEDNNVLLVDKDYWFKYYDIVQSEWKDKDGNYYGDSIRIVKEADPEAKEAEMIENYNSESQDIEPDNMAGIGGLLGDLMVASWEGYSSLLQKTLLILSTLKQRMMSKNQRSQNDYCWKRM